MRIVVFGMLVMEISWLTGVGVLFGKLKKPTVPLKIVKSNKLFYVLRVLYRGI